MITDRRGSVVRYNRRSRLLHTASYLATGALLFTGWRLVSGHEGQRSAIARALGQSDVELHRKAGWLLASLAIVAVTLGVRGSIAFLRETARVDRGDGRWFVRWPLGAVTGRFAAHRGHFDPGQRIMNVLFVATLGTLIGSGTALTTVHGGPSFIYLVRAHRYATYVLTVLVAIHVLVAIGILPGYRGVWRSMHLGGRTPRATAQRLWPAATAEADDRPRSPRPDEDNPGEQTASRSPVSSRRGRG